MSEDYQTIIIKGIHMELADWLLAKKKQPRLIVRRMSGKPRMRLSRVLSDEARRMGWFVSGVLGFMAVAYWLIR